MEASNGSLYGEWSSEVRSIRQFKSMMGMKKPAPGKGAGSSSRGAR
jgi:hypothetical protein